MFHKTKVNKEVVTVSGVCPTKTTIVAAQSGYRIKLNQIVGGNLLDSVRAITFWEGETQLAPRIVLGSSGTMIWDGIGGKDGLKLERGSGIYACLDGTGQVDVTAYYVLFDERQPLSKEAYRANTYNNVTVTRRPNVRGSQ